METLFRSMEGHANIWIGILLTIFVLDIGIHIFYDRKTISVRQKKRYSGNKLDILRYLQDKVDEAYILIEKTTYVPVFVSGNFESLFGIKPERVYTDFSSLFEGLSEEDGIQLRGDLKRWNRRDIFERQFVWTLFKKEKYCQLIVVGDIDCPDLLFVLRDITGHKKSLDVLEQEVLDTKHSEEAKTVFLSNMSHEIRTPLNGMLGMIRLAKMNLDSSELAVGYLDKAQDLSSFLLSVINDILDMSRIDSGKTELEQVPFDIRSIGVKLDGMFRTTMSEKGIQFKLELLEINQPYVVGDQLRISQVLTNFLSNSQKFTPEGGEVTLMIRQMDIVDDKVSWMFRVKDTGKGMSPEFLHRIFKPFEQEDSGITRKYGGSGLGMSIADSLVRLMGGQILIESELDKGTIFTVFLKLPMADVSKIQEQLADVSDDAPVNLAGCRFLLAEDHDINAEIVVKILGVQQIEVEVAKNGVEAVDMFKNHADNYYDAILMDIQMPEMNGWDAARAIRASGRAQASVIPILALSADAYIEDKRKSIAAGMDGHITKPIDFEELKRALQSKIVH